jgi:hypothetical protein
VMSVKDPLVYISDGSVQEKNTCTVDVKKTCFGQQVYGHGVKKENSFYSTCTGACQSIVLFDRCMGVVSKDLVLLNKCTCIVKVMFYDHKCPKAALCKLHQSLSFSFLFSNLYICNNNNNNNNNNDNDNNKTINNYFIIYI